MDYKLNILKSTVEIGLEKPVKLLHVTDTHLSFEDPDVSYPHHKAFAERNEGYINYFLQAIEYAKTNNMPILHTGDIINFLSQANFDFAEKHLSDVDYMIAAGNHDFCQVVGYHTENYIYKWENIKKIAPYLKNNMYFYSRVIGGVNIVMMDDSYYSISEGQIEMLRAEAAKGYPILLCMHVPIFEKSLADAVMAEGQPCAYVVAPADEYLAKYPDDRREQQIADSTTLRAVEYIKNEPLIKAVVTGHTHINFEAKLDNGVIQFNTGANYKGYVRELTII